MDKRILLRLALVAFAVAVIFGLSRGAIAVEQQLTPKAYMPLISNAPMAIAWDLAGNANTNPLLHFLGTTDGKPLIIQPVAGNVGIGTTAPGAGLEINKAATNDVALLLKSSGPGWGSGIRFTNTAPGGKTYGMYSAPDGKWHFADNDAQTSRIVIDRTGNVGMGTTTPVGKLTIATAANGESGLVHTAGGINLSTGIGSGAAFFGTTTNHPLNLVSGNASVMHLTPAREVVMASSVVPSGKLTIQTDRNDQSGIALFSPTEDSLQIGVNSAFAILAASKPLRLLAGDGSIVLNTDGKVGIGRDPDPNARLAVSGSTEGIVGTGTSGLGVGGIATTGFGLFGRTTTGTVTYLQTDTGEFARGDTSEGSRFHITNAGTFVAGSDFAEALPARSIKDTYSPGDVLVLSTDAPGGVERASEPYDVRVAGVYSTRPGVLGADKDGETRVDINDVPVALVGIVPTKVSAENGPIQVGDQLTTSATPGHAMRCADRMLCLGAVIGKAMQPMQEGTGVIKVLVTLR